MLQGSAVSKLFGDRQTHLQKHSLTHLHERFVEGPSPLKTISRVKYVTLLLLAIFLLSPVFWQDEQTEVGRTTEFLQQVNFESNVTTSPGSEELEVDSSTNRTTGPKKGILTKLQRRQRLVNFMIL